MDSQKSGHKFLFMSTSGNKVQNEIDPGKIKESLQHIGAGELKIWKYTVLTDEQAFGKVFDLIFSDDQKVAWRSAWIIDSASEEFPDLISDYLSKIIVHFSQTQNSSLKRILTRMLSRYKIPEEFLGLVVDRCYKLLSPLEPVAVRVNAMIVLYNIARQEPDLKPELATVLSGIIEEGGSAGLMNKAEKIMKKLWRDKGL